MNVPTTHPLHRRASALPRVAIAGLSWDGLSRFKLATAFFVCLSMVMLATGCETNIVNACGQGPSTGGRDVPPVIDIEMGATSGTFDFRYETRNARDQVEVFYDGKSLFNSGCVGESRDMKLRYGPGESSQIQVILTPNCEGTPMTSWLFEVGCPVSSIPSIKVSRPSEKPSERPSERPSR